jgi:hypothetical protein
MNDLDLSAALHRDADLVGEPSPDLLDQLGRRRARERRRRTALLAAMAGVLVIGAGIPLGRSFLISSDARPATQGTVELTPSVTPTPSVSSEAPPPAAVTPPPATPEPPVISSAPLVAADPPCDWAAMRAAMPADTPQHTYTLAIGQGEVCSGGWAAAGYSEKRLLDGRWVSDGQAALFQFVDGSWTWLDRYAGGGCDRPGIPAAVRQRGCNVD